MARIGIASLAPYALLKRIAGFIMIRSCIAVVLCLALGACGQSAPSKKTAAQEKREADALLFKDIATAEPELERRLMASIRVEDGLLLVRSTILGELLLNVLPTNSPWVISCGLTGLSVVLGTSVKGEDTDDIKLYLSFATIDKKDCDIIGPRLGRRLRTILQGNQSVLP